MLKDIQSSAAALYDGGWRASDRDELIQEYDLTSDEADALCKELERIGNNNMEDSKMTINVVFDNGGGTTIMAEVNGKKYTHNYDHPDQAAQDYKAMLEPDCDFDDWDGNDTEHTIEYDADQIRNGGYVWLDPEDIACKRYADWGFNTESFYAAL